MYIYVGSFAYLAYIFLAVLLCFLLYCILKNRSKQVQTHFVFALALVNFLQHVFKLVIYPQYKGSTDFYLTTAYNVCAFLITVSPFIIAFGNGLFKNFITYVGSVAGMVAMVVPYWFIGKPALTWDAFRFYFCHALLFISSFLPALLGLHRLERRHRWKIGFLFLGVLALILVNDTILIITGNYPYTTPDKIYEGLCIINPCWAMTPPKNLAWVEDIIACFTPSVLMGNNAAHLYVPILWYAFPLYLGISLLVYAVSFLARIFVKATSPSPMQNYLKSG